MKRIHMLAICIMRGLLLNRYTFTKPKLCEYFQIQARLLSSAIRQLNTFWLETFDKFSYMWKRKELITADSEVANGNSYRWWDLIAQKSSLKTIWNKNKI